MSNPQKGKVFVAMSGGVDSSAAALLLKKQGYNITGVFMRCFNLDGCSETDAEDARRVAEHLGIPFYVFDFEEEYKRDVVEYMVDGYKRGITPNPDVMCNKYIKFGLFLKRAFALGADYIATGHYVRIKNEKLYEAKDKNKDQSYFLWTLTQNELKHCLFPIGDYIKPQVREIAKKAKLPTAEKKDSQGVCFLGKVSVHDFLKQYISETPGEVITTEGKKIGEHEGAQFYTIGQRHGLDLKAKNKRLKMTGRHETKPHYVVSKDVKTNTITVAEGDENPALFKKEIALRNINIINPQHSHILQNVRMLVLTRVRYRQPLAEAGFVLGKKTAKLVFNKSQKFVAPGQSAVLYNKNGELLGGGIIE
ncbi:MAG: tRNA 2-thiouridine(34) synthase MnmA [Candidatus Jorgensenbacteria bacterium]|nr:tRNA 2-thiouridine(34) synthase MnmA [Candidatus Jorgensenbacteria bacterium]